MIKLNTWAIITIINAVLIIRDGIDMIGTQQTLRTEPYDILDVLLIWAFVVCVFLLGKYSKFLKDE